MEIDDKIKNANEKLKSGGTRVLILRRDNFLWLRGILPPKPHINKKEDYRQAISFGKNAIASDKGIQYAVSKAKIVTGQLLAGTFNWEDWINLDKVAPNRVEARKVRDWCREYESAHWDRVERTPEQVENWRKDQGAVFRNLPQDEDLTLEVLLECIRSKKPSTRSRKRACDYCYRLAEFAGIEDREKIKSLKGSYSAKSVDPRKLPSDEAIAQFVDNIKDLNWKWVIGMMATFGLRNHEVFRGCLKSGGIL